MILYLRISGENIEYCYLKRHYVNP